MHSFTKDDFQAGAAATGQDDISGNELRILRDLLQLLPAGVTVQDEQGQFILQSENPAYSPRYILENDELTIWGVVTHSLRNHLTHG